MIQVKFKFEPRQKVRVTAFSLGCEGRVSRCSYSGSSPSYLVEYASDGKIQYNEFCEDDLEDARLWRQ